MATGCCGVKRQKVSVPPEKDDQDKSERPSSSSSYNSKTSSNHVPNGKASFPRDRQAMNGYGPGDKSYHNGYVEKPINNGLVVCADMCYFCFDVLSRKLHRPNSEPFRGTPKFTDAPFPLFVTWKIGSDRKLRGCIGTFTAMNLHDGLREYAISSAFKDSRFQPVQKEELSRLHCSVSLLRHFEQARGHLDWEVGVHGIRIEFYNEKGNKKTATYLPEVATEQCWSKQETIDSLLRKGGYKSNITHEFRKSIHVTRYQSEKLTVSYAEYSAHRQNGHNGYC